VIKARSSCCARVKLAPSQAGTGTVKSTAREGGCGREAGRDGEAVDNIPGEPYDLARPKSVAGVRLGEQLPVDEL
jgi:hypothetical protein